MRTLTRLRRSMRESRIRLGKRVKNVPDQLAKQANKVNGDNTFATLHPTKGWRVRSYKA